MTTSKSFRKLFLAPAAIFLALLFTSPAAFADENVKVGRVIDGDTIKLVDGRKVRLLGINTPERREPYYHKARRYLESRVLDREVRLEYEADLEDAYGRLLAYVHAGRSMLNEELLREGLAHVLIIGESRKYERRLLAAQAEAKKKRKALWSVWTRAKVLKITSIHPYNPSRPSAYMRLVCLADKPLQLAGHVLSNEAGDRFVFPRYSLAPGYSIIVSASDTGTSSSQEVFQWPGIMKFNEQQDTAFLLDPAGNVIDQFSYSQARPKSRKTKSQTK